MITLLINLTTKNAGGAKTASVFALNDANAVAGVDFNFQVLNEAHSVKADFAANEGKTISCGHTATGKGLVRVSAGTAMDQRFCDVDAPTCDGLSAAGIMAVLKDH